MNKQLKTNFITPVKVKTKDIQITKVNRKMNKDVVRHVMFSHTP